MRVDLVLHWLSPPIDASPLELLKFAIFCGVVGVGRVGSGCILKAMTHQPTQLLSRIGSGPVGVCVIGLQLDVFLHSSLIPDSMVGSGPPTTQQLSWVS